MAVIEVKLPELGENIDQADVVAVLVSAGDRIRKDQPLIEVESEKASVEIPSPFSGVVRELRVRQGDRIRVGQTILLIETEDARAESRDTRAGVQEARLQAQEPPRAADESPAAPADTREARHEPSRETATEPQDEAARHTARHGAPARGSYPLEARRLAPGRREAQDTRSEPTFGQGTEETRRAPAGGREIPSPRYPRVGIRYEEDRSAAGRVPAEAPASRVPDDRGSTGSLRLLMALATPGKDQGELVPAGPSERRLARELGVEIRDVRGSGPGGRISVEDVKEHARRLITEIGAAVISEARQAPRFREPEPRSAQGTGGTAARAPETLSVKDLEPAFRREIDHEPERPSDRAPSRPQPETGPVRAQPPPLQPPLPDFEKWGEIRREPLGSLRRTAGRTTAVSWALIPHVTQFDHADVTDLEDQRQALARAAAEAGGKLTLTAIVIKVAALALRKFQQFNASLDAEEAEVIFKGYVNIGVAVDTERGLVVPVIREADRKPLGRIAAELTDLAERARGKRLAPDEMTGANLSVTNLGGLGTTYFTPIVTWPHVAVLGVGRAEVQPVYRNGQFVPRRILPLSVSYDHRLIDGADAARFLRWIAEALENPLKLLVEDW